MARAETKKLLDKDEFRSLVFARDGGKCVFCDSPAADAHHIMERKLFRDGGYYLDNGASVCPEHHMLCETTEISVEEVLAACGIAKRVLPDHLSDGETYDKWGNPVLSNGTRLMGELFHDDGAQAALARGGVLARFTHHVKYPRTFHFDWSDSVSEDDKVITDLSGFDGAEVVATVKMDGENATLYRDHFHARSLDSRHHPSRDWIKGYWSSVREDIPELWRFCGENLFAVHSIEYGSLPSYFMGFSVWNERNVALPWDETLEWFDLLGMTPVEVAYRGPFDVERLRAVAADVISSGHEGIVVRVTSAIPYRHFPRLVAKAVRPGHVQTDRHWMQGPVRRNGLSAESGFGASTHGGSPVRA